jgi:hypothetical protein
MSKNVLDIFNLKKKNVPTVDIDQVRIDSALFESSSTVHSGTVKQSNKHLQHNKLISDLGTLDTGPVRPLLKVSIFSFYLYLGTYEILNSNNIRLSN